MIHDTAIISETSKLADNVEIGAYSIIGPNVKISNNTKVMGYPAKDIKKFILENK